MCGHELTSEYILAIPTHLTDQKVRQPNYLVVKLQ